MALLKKDKGTDTLEKTTTVSGNENLSWVLVGPRVTEKAAMISGDNVYTFDVAQKANKIEIKKAIFAAYKVKPEKVNIIAKKARSIVKRGRKAHQRGSKKALVYLKKGDTIDLA